MADLLVLGSGIAGCAAAIHAAQRGLSVILCTKGEMAHSATRYAQGGVAAALESPDSVELHLSDTLAAGAGLCDTDAVRVLVSEGPERVRELIALGARFDLEDGALARAREGGHSLARVVHAGGDATGAEIERALGSGVRALDGVDVREGWFSVDLLVEGGRCVGVQALEPSGELREVRAAHTLLATGGAGQLYAVTTNPAVSTGDGIAMSLRAGAAVADVEFMQFHPTALDTATMPRPLLSEALRGDGAVLRDAAGEAFMAGEHPLADLAPRDVVARAITRRILECREPHMWLDCTAIDDFSRRFPTISAASRAVGLDPGRDFLPVAPAAHYLSGGVCTDLDGAATLPALWACGETACSGVHGANRLASNSLLDGLVFAPRVVEAIAAGREGPRRTGVLRSGWPAAVPAPVAAARAAAATGARPEQLRARLAASMTANAGVLRDRASLERAARDMADLEAEASGFDHREPGAWEVRNLLAVAASLVGAASAREESRGTHARLDFPRTEAGMLGRFFLTGGDVSFVPLAAEVRA